MWHVFPPQQAFDQENALHCVPTSFPVRLTQNEALCHCQIALQNREEHFKGHYEDEWEEG